MTEGLVRPGVETWQNREEWFFRREYTDTYEQWYEGRYKRSEVWQKKVMKQLVIGDDRVKTLLEFGCGTGRFTRWWKEIGIVRVIREALAGRNYSVEWTATGLPAWFPVQQWGIPFGDFFGLYIKFRDEA